MKTLCTIAILGTLLHLPCLSDEDTVSPADLAFVDIIGDYFLGTNRLVIADRLDEFNNLHWSKSYSSVAKDLASHLHGMAQEDSEWKEPHDKTSLSKSQLVAYAIYHIRDIACCPNGNPAQCLVLEDWQGISRTQKVYNASLDLKQLGVSIVPFLLPLLEDRRPTRSVGWHRSFHLDTYVVLRYQDVAIQLLNAIAGREFYTESTTGGYFSTEPYEVRRKVIEAVLGWYKTEKAEPPGGGAGVPSPHL